MNRVVRQSGSQPVVTLQELKCRSDSFGLLAAALKTIPVGTGYAVWTGIGAAGTAIVGMACLGESREVMRILCIGLIVAGVVGLKFASASGH